MARADWIRYIRANAPRYGIDPAAALAVASAEGLSGAVGDQGTSFGPFQLHVGGALPSGRGQAWAESPAGLDYALRQIGLISRGLRGQAAVNAIVRRFERPADPTGEIARAMGAYGSFGGGVTPGSVVANAVVPGPTGSKTKTVRTPGIPAATLRVPQFNAQGLASGIFSSIAQGGLPNIANLVSQSWSTAPVTIPGVAGTKRTTVVPGRKPARVPPGVPPGAVPTPGGWFDPARGKIIGTPGHGTHTLGNWESDRAYDVAVPVGTPIYAPFGGRIGSQFGALTSDPNSRFGGLRLHIVNPNNEWYGAHLSRFAPGIRPGVVVRPGQLIGYSGSASGVAHLHEALRYGNIARLIAGLV